MTIHFIKGILLGITVAFIIGPVFFPLLQTSLYRGFRAGVQLAFGVVLSDLAVIILSYIGILQVINNDNNNLIVGCIGGILLIIIGIVTITRKPSVNARENAPNINMSKPGFFTYASKGFLMNIMNPFLLIFWVSVMSIHGANEDVEKSIIIAFFTGTLFAIFATDILKCYVAKKIKRFITDNTLKMINTLVGIALLIFGLVLIFRVVFLT